MNKLLRKLNLSWCIELKLLWPINVHNWFSDLNNTKKVNIGNFVYHRKTRIGPVKHFVLKREKEIEFNSAHFYALFYVHGEYLVNAKCTKFSFTKSDSVPSCKTLCKVMVTETFKFMILLIVTNIFCWPWTRNCFLIN